MIIDFVMDLCSLLSLYSTLISFEGSMEGANRSSFAKVEKEGLSFKIDMSSRPSDSLVGEDSFLELFFFVFVSFVDISCSLLKQSSAILFVCAFVFSSSKPVFAATLFTDTLVSLSFGFKFS